MTALQLTWDGNSTVTTTIHGKYFKSGTKGLCGKWDGKPGNDLTMQNGQVSKDVGKFGWSWKYGGKKGRE